MNSTPEQASLAELLPTPLLKGTALMLVTSAPGAFFLLETQLPKMGLTHTTLELHLASFAGAACVGLLFALLLAMEACWVLYRTRAKRVITKFSNQHPYMSWQWLADNAQLKHVVVLTLFSLSMVGLGSAVASFFICN